MFALFGQSREWHCFHRETAVHFAQAPLIQAVVKRKIDIVVPVRNEQDNIPVFIDAVNGLKLPGSVSIGIIFVEDGSTDGTLDVLRHAAETAGNVSFYSLEEGFGEGPAVVFGMSRSHADAVVTMEVGGGHPVESVPEMISRHLDGADIVQAVRRSIRSRPLYRSVGTAVFNAVFRLLAGFDTKGQNVYYRLLSRKYKDSMVESRECVTSLRFRLPDSSICRVDKVYFDAEDRTRGKSKYGFVRLARLSLDFMLSVMPASRLCIIIVLTLVLISILALFVNIPLSLVVAFGMLWIVVRRRKLWHNNILSRMSSKEQHVA